MAIQKIHFNTYNRTVRDLLRGERVDGEEQLGHFLDFNPSYQRASVWTQKQRVALIQSSLQGLPVGAIFINDRGYKPGGME